MVIETSMDMAKTKHRYPFARNEMGRIENREHREEQRVAFKDEIINLDLKLIVIDIL